MRALPKEQDIDIDAMLGLEVVAQVVEQADQGGGGAEKGPEIVATPTMQELIAGAEGDLRTIDAEPSVADFTTTTTPVETPANRALITTSSATTIDLVTTLSKIAKHVNTGAEFPEPTITPLVTTSSLSTTIGPVTTLSTTTNHVTTGAQFPVPALALGSYFQDNDSDGEETPVVNQWCISPQRSRSTSVAAFDADDSLNSLINEDTTLEELMASVPPPPLERSKVKATPAASTLARTFSGRPAFIPGPGFIPGRRNRPESSIPPHILQTLIPAPTKGQAALPAPQQPHTPGPVDVTPNLLKWPAAQCEAFKWLVSGAEGWGDWVTAVRLLMDFREKAGFPVRV